jgi:thiopeptide-type bacteriocin biosynthesis protein
MALCRTPAFTEEDELFSKWDDLKLMIRDSSPEFYRIIKDKRINELSELPDKIKFTIWKYFNRAKYRATPFGGFAAVSLVRLGNQPGNAVRLQRDTVARRFWDWKEAVGVSRLNNTIEDTTQIRSNSTIYVVGNELRYIRQEQHLFQLTTIPSCEWINMIIQFCRTPVTVSELFALSKTTIGCNAIEIKDIVAQLLYLEVIYSDRRPNITGRDFFERLGLSNAGSDACYRIDRRTVIEGQFSEYLLKDISEFLNFRRQLGLQETPAGLKNFFSSFKQKYGDGIVSLAQALDPEIGISYCGLEEEVTGGDFIPKMHRHLSFNGERSNGFLFPDRLLGFLLNGLASNQDIHLENFVRASGLAVNSFPNSFPVLISFIDNLPVIESAGGVTANSLLGRFSLVDESYANLSRDVSAIEQTANPDVIFFEIAYIGEKEIDNINRRINSYEYELPLLSWSSGEGSLNISDIMVFIRGDELILWSTIHQKRLIPRLSSAYNFKRSDLALFRFLCDLQSQNLTCDMNFKLSEVLPGCDVYPRVYYKTILVSAKMWRIPARFLKIQDYNAAELLDSFRLWLEQNKVSRFFKFGKGDQVLLFNSADPQELIYFLTICSKMKPDTDTLIREASAGCKLFTDEIGKTFHPEIVLTYYHNECIYHPAPLPSYYNGKISGSASEIKKFHLPGSDWIYLEIYCHSVRTNVLLMQYLVTLLKEASLLIDKWFFVRYDVPSHHIRLRIKLTDRRNTGELIRCIESWAKPILVQDVISDIQIKTYFPETHRYHYSGINTCETIFWLDSEHVLRLLKCCLDENETYVHTLLLMAKLFGLLSADREENIRAVAVMGNSFAKEFSWDGQAFKIINVGFNGIKQGLQNLHRVDFLGRPDRLLKYTKRALDGKHDNDAALKFIVDLIHMHINRLFASRQREHEGVLYQFLLKYLKMQAVLSKYPLLC